MAELLSLGLSAESSCSAINGNQTLDGSVRQLARRISTPLERSMRRLIPWERPSVADKCLRIRSTITSSGGFFRQCHNICDE
eukprot:scaffold1588_cov133-Skeletonema_menzelii.AAC.3